MQWVSGGRLENAKIVEIRLNLEVQAVRSKVKIALRDTHGYRCSPLIHIIILYQYYRIQEGVKKVTQPQIKAPKSKYVGLLYMSHYTNIMCIFCMLYISKGACTISANILIASYL